MNTKSPILENILYLLSWTLLGGFLYYLEAYTSGDNFTEGLYLAAFTFLGFLFWLIYLGSEKKHYKIFFHITMVSVFVLTAFWATATLSVFFFLVPDGQWKGINF